MLNVFGCLDLGSVIAEENTIRQVPCNQLWDLCFAVLVCSLHGAAASEELFKEAMEKGYVLCRNTLCLLIGVAGSGKTHVKHLLLHLLPPECREITPMFEPPVRAASLSRASCTSSTSASGRIWKVVSPDELDEMLVTSIKAVGSHQSADAFNNPGFSQLVNVCGMSLHELDEVMVESESSVLSETPSKLCSTFNSGDACSQSTDKCDSSTLSNVESELLKLLGKSSGSQQLFEVDWVYLLDSGGQPQFQQLLPAFVKCATAILITTKLNESLHDYPTVEYYDRSGRRCAKCVSSTSNLEFFLRNVRVMQSRFSVSSEEEGPNVFVIGTHKDLEGCADESRTYKNSRLVEILRPMLGEKLVFFNLAKEELIFPVNARDPGLTDQEVADELREMIMDMSDHLPVKIPLPWWVFERFLRKLASKKGVKLVPTRVSTSCK